MTQNLMTRIGFCQKCFDSAKPHDGQKMLLLGSHGWHVDICHPKRIPRHPIGYTPHLYKYIRLQNENVIAKTVCCIDGCDIQIKPLADGTYNFMILESKWREQSILISDWNALIKYKRDLDYII